VAWRHGEGVVDGAALHLHIVAHTCCRVAEEGRAASQQDGALCNKQSTAVCSVALLSYTLQLVMLRVPKDSCQIAPPCGKQRGANLTIEFPQGGWGAWEEGEHSPWKLSWSRCCRR
jgi:hypothetical protein